MAAHSSILAWRIPWTEEPNELQSMESQRIRHDRATEHTLVKTNEKLQQLGEKQGWRKNWVLVGLGWDVSGKVAMGDLGVRGPPTLGRDVGSVLSFWWRGCTLVLEAAPSACCGGGGSDVQDDTTVLSLWVPVRGTKAPASKMVNME